MSLILKIKRNNNKKKTYEVGLVRKHSFMSKRQIKILNHEKISKYRLSKQGHLFGLLFIDGSRRVRTYR